MEADASLKMVKDYFRQHYFIIDSIISDNYSKMRAVLKHTPRDFHGQVLNSSKLKLDD